MMQAVLPELILPKKKVDEARQGTAYGPETVAATGPGQKRFYIESYGCAMNFADSEIVASSLQGEGFGATRNAEEADLILINTCSIREKAEQTVRNRLQHLRGFKKHNRGLIIGVLGCMAERLKSKFLEEEKLVDIVVGPDAYRALPGLVREAGAGQKGVNVLLSREETYADIAPVRLDSNGVAAYVSIMRGCNNMCSFCVVPFTRGRERSRDAESIVAECRHLFQKGYREVTLLGQNVDSYHWTPAVSGAGEGTSAPALPIPQGGLSAQRGEDVGTTASPPLRGMGRPGEPVTFAILLDHVARISPLLRVRFSTSHPKDITDEVLHTMARHANICKYIHLPIQSGSTRVLQLMNRTYTREWYLEKVRRIREIMPDCGLSTDVITGFCTETEEDHRDTLSAMEQSRYDMAYMYAYSERPGTLAARRFEDDVPVEAKQRRLEEIIALQNRLSRESYAGDVGKVFEVLIEKTSKRSEQHWSGRNSQNKTTVFAKNHQPLKPGDYAMVRVTSATQTTLVGEIV